MPKVFRSHNFDVGVVCKHFIVRKLRLEGVTCGKPSVLIELIRPKVNLYTRIIRHGKPCFYVGPVGVPCAVAAATYPCVCRRIRSFVHRFVIVRADGSKHQIRIGVKLLTFRIRIIVIRRRCRQVCVICKVRDLDRRSCKTVCFAVYVSKQIVQECKECIRRHTLCGTSITLTSIRVILLREIENFIFRMLVRHRNQLSTDICNEIAVRRSVAVRRITKLIRCRLVLYFISCVRVACRGFRCIPRMRRIPFCAHTKETLCAVNCTCVRAVRIAVYGMRHRRIDKFKGVVPFAVIPFKDAVTHRVQAVCVCLIPCAVAAVFKRRLVGIVAICKRRNHTAVYVQIFDEAVKRRILHLCSIRKRCCARTNTRHCIRAIAKRNFQEFQDCRMIIFRVVRHDVNRTILHKYAVFAFVQRQVCLFKQRPIADYDTMLRIVASRRFFKLHARCFFYLRNQEVVSVVDRCACLYAICVTKSVLFADNNRIIGHTVFDEVSKSRRFGCFAAEDKRLHPFGKVSNIFTRLRCAIVSRQERFRTFVRRNARSACKHRLRRIHIAKRLNIASRIRNQIYTRHSARIFLRGI